MMKMAQWILYLNTLPETKDWFKNSPRRYLCQNINLQIEQEFPLSDIIDGPVTNS